LLASPSTANGTTIFVTVGVIAYSWLQDNDKVNIPTLISYSSCRGFNIKEAYEIQGILGEGAFGKVFSAIRRKDQKQVAIKAMPQQFSKSNDFEREITALKLLAKPGHSNVCKLVDQHQNKGYFFLVMEMITGGELFEYLIQNGAFSENDASKFLRQFADALDYMHSKDLVHADLKPENLMLSTTSVLKVVDFGCTVNPNNVNPKTMDIFGTLAYSSPEQYHHSKQTKRHPMLPTPAMDMFAAGLIMYILLVGSHPFDPYGVKTDEEVAEAIGECDLKKVFDERTEHLSPLCIELLGKLLKANPKHRMTAIEFNHDPWIQGRSVSLVSLPNIDTKLQIFWQKRLRAAILKKFNADGQSLTEARLRKMFYTMDLDGNGEISMEELKTALNRFQDKKNMQDLLTSADLDGNGSIDYQEFKTIMQTAFDTTETNNAISGKKVRETLLESFGFKYNASKTVSKEKLRQVFDSMDLDGDGKLQISELRQALKNFLGMDENAISAWADAVDSNMDGTIDFDEFCRAMRKAQ